MLTKYEITGIMLYILYYEYQFMILIILLLFVIFENCILVYTDICFILLYYTYGSEKIMASVLFKCVQVYIQN